MAYADETAYPAPHMSPDTILGFWFSEQARPLWFNATREFDATIRDRFLSVWRRAAAGELAVWADTPKGVLALVIMLDQFPLNMFRGRAEAFATEGQAREIARLAVNNGWDQALSDEEKAFLYLPFMHSESLPDQDESVRLYERASLTDNLKWAYHHRELIRRFGRFPHRNALLGRPSDSDETAYLQSEQAYHG